MHYCFELVCVCVSVCGAMVLHCFAQRIPMCWGYTYHSFIKPQRATAVSECVCLSVCIFVCVGMCVRRQAVHVMRVGTLEGA